MRKRILAAIPILLLALTFCQKGFAQPNIRSVDGGKYAWLLDQSINGICQDRDRFLWISTYGGLLRYDGAEFQLMTHDPGDPNSLSNNNVGKICADPARGGLWVCTQSGLDYFNPETGQFEHACFRDKDDSVSPIRSRIQDILIFPDKIICCSSSKVYQCETTAENPVFATVDLDFQPLSLCNYDGKQILAANHKGLYMVDRTTWEQTAFAPARTSTYSHSFVYYSPITERIYVGGSIGTRSAAFRFENGQLTADNSFVPDNLHTVCDSNGKTLFGTNGNGLYILENGHVSRMTTEDGLGSDVIYTLCNDSQGNLWLGFYRGGLMLSQKMMESFSVISPFKMVTSIIPDEKSIYVGMDSYGLGIYDRESGKCKIFNTSNSALPGNNIVSMTRLGDEIWMAVYTKGLCSFNTQTQTFRTWSLEGHDELYVDNNKTWVIRHDQRERLWVGGPSLFIFSPQDHVFTKVDGFESKFISSISFHDNVAFISTRNNGIYEVDTNTLDILATYNTATVDGFPENDIRYTFMDSHGRLWFDSQTNGFYSFNADKSGLTRYNENDGLLNSSVTTISEAPDGNLWMGTLNGLYYYSYTSGHFVYLGNEAYIPAQYLFSSSHFDGTNMYFGSTDGLVIFNAGDMETRRGADKVTFTGLTTLSEKPQKHLMYSPMPAPVKLAGHDNFFQVSFAVPEYLFPESVRFSCRLKGLEKDWRDIGNLRAITFTGLEAGDYELEVRYACMDESWSEPSSLSISILPKWYATWWARLLGILILLGAAATLFRAHWRQQKIKEKIRISEIEKKSIKEANEEKMDFFTRIIHDLRTPIFLISTQVESLSEHQTAETAIPGNYLESLLRNTRKLTRLVNRLIDFRKLDSGKFSLRLRDGDVAAFCENMATDYKELCSKKSILFTFQRPDHPVPLTFDAEKLESILSNLISNAFKYTQEGGKVSLQLEEGENEVNFSVTDTGIGIRPEDQEKIFDYFSRTENGMKLGSGDGIGLTMVKSLIEAHGGKITVESEPDKGSTFRFFIPRGLSADNHSDAVIEDDPVVVPEKPSGVQVSVSNPTASHMILIVDDDVETADLLERCLESSYTILKANSGEEGFSLVERMLPDLVICDLDMPGMNGHDFLLRLRKDQKLSGVKIIILTGSNSEEDMLKTLDEGADAHLLKPISLKELKLRISRLLEKEQPRFPEQETVEKRHGPTREEQVFLLRCREIIDQHLTDEDFKMDTMAEMLAMSHSSLYKKIKAITGLSLIGFVNDYKIHKAVLLFRQGETNVTAVCERCGFKDEKNFRDLFKKKTGQTPKQFVLGLNTKNTR